MKLSIIIVNYNVRYFLEQCLTSVFKAVDSIDAEVFVVDNKSSDDSMQMVKKCFPKTKIIENKENVGFSKANNQAIDISKGEYTLLLNPDTIVEEDTFEKCIEFMDSHPDAGGLGAKMIDGNGIFLPESKRGLPTPSVSFYKISGLSNLFPKSKTFAKYHLGYLNENETNEIEILSGAFMWMRKSVLDEIGLLDEAFFMYGEDIDLSYRIIKAGYKNYYYPKARIIHYKGESTKKGSINYVFIFYNAMIIFSKKHFSSGAKTFSFFINIAIYLRAFLSILLRFFTSIKLPLIDTILILAGLILLNYLKPHLGFPNQISLDNYGLINVGTVISTILIGISITGGYSKSVSVNKTTLGLVIGSILLYVINFLFPENASFSNKYLISMILGFFVIIPTSRILLHYFNKLKLRKGKRSTIIAGTVNFINKTKPFVNKTSNLFYVKEDNNVFADDKNEYLGKLSQLPDLIEIYNVNEVVFSSKDISYHDIIKTMASSKSNYVDFKISLNNSTIIGTNTVEKIA